MYITTICKTHKFKCLFIYYSNRPLLINRPQRLIWPLLPMSPLFLHTRSKKLMSVAALQAQENATYKYFHNISKLQVGLLWTLSNNNLREKYLVFFFTILSLPLPRCNQISVKSNLMGCMHQMLILKAMKIRQGCYESNSYGWIWDRCARWMAFWGRVAIVIITTSPMHIFLKLLNYYMTI